MVLFLKLLDGYDGQAAAESDPTSETSSTADLLGEGDFEELSKQIERERLLLNHLQKLLNLALDDCIFVATRLEYQAKSKHLHGQLSQLKFDMEVNWSYSCM